MPSSQISQFLGGQPLDPSLAKDLSDSALALGRMLGFVTCALLTGIGS